MRSGAAPVNARDAEPADGSTDLDATDPTLQPVTMEQALARGATAAMEVADPGAATIINMEAPAEVLRVVAELAAAEAARAAEAAARAGAAAPARPEVPSFAATVVAEAPPLPAAAPVAIAPTPMAAAGPGQTVQTAGARASAPTVQRGAPPPASGSAGPRKKGFRETAWFRRGEIEEEMARKAAEMSADDPLAGPAQTEAVVDESALTADDRARLSLKTGRTEMMQAVKPSHLPGERMSEQDVLAEMDGGSRRSLIIGGVVLGVIVVLAAVYLLFMR
jgi:hypothetical protein